MKGIWEHVKAVGKRLEGYGFILSLAGAAILVMLALGVRAWRTSGEREAEPVSAGAKVQTAAPNPTPEPSRAPLRFPVSGVVLDGHRPEAPAWSDTLQQYVTHRGMDIAAPLGTAVCAAAEGTVCSAYEDAYLGYVVEVRHEDGMISRYANLMGLQLAEVGDRVEEGDVIGSVGKSALREANMPAHLHFEVEKNGENMDPAVLCME